MQGFMIEKLHGNRFYDKIEGAGDYVINCILKANIFLLQIILYMSLEI